MQITELRGRGERAGPEEFSQGRGQLLIASSLCPSKSPSPTPHLVWKISLDIKPCVLGTKSLLHTGASQELHTHHSMESSHQEYEDYCPHMRREDTCPERLSNMSRLHYGLVVHSCFSRPTLCSALCPGEAGSPHFHREVAAREGGRRGWCVYASTLFTWGLSLAEVVRSPFLPCALLPKAMALAESQA